MVSFFSVLHKRNRLLSWFGWANLAAALVCMILSQRDLTIVLGINAWIKPIKFFLSIAVFSFTMAWLLNYLNMPVKVKYYSVMVVIVMIYEMFVITWQASNGRLSHFNISSPLYTALFDAMGAAIAVLTIWTGYIAYLFFRKSDFNLPLPYLWGIRLGLLIFVMFAFEGGVMAARLAHTVGAVDGGPGLAFVNWSRNHGDLRVAHFFGMHALQILPLAGYYLTQKTRQLFLFSILYFLLVVVFLVEALLAKPVI